MSWESSADAVRLTPLLLERHVLGKINFDPAGLIVAFRGETPVGFVHVGFAPTQAKDAIDYSLAVLCALVVPGEDQREEIVRTLLDAGEAYAYGRGAESLFCGGSPSLEPFWLGLACGPRLPGVPENDLELTRILQSRGFQPVETRVVYSGTLGRLISPVNPEIFRCLRQYQVVFGGEPQLSDWWELVTLDPFEMSCFQLLNRSDGSLAAWVRILHRIGPAGPDSPHPLAVWDLHPVSVDLPPSVLGFFLSQTARELSRINAKSLELQFRWSIGSPPAPEAELLPPLLNMNLCSRGTVFRKELR